MDEELDGSNQEEAVNSPSTESAPVENQAPEANPPAEESSAPAEKPEAKTIPYDRFKEVIDEKNALNTKLKEIEDRLNKQEQTAFSQAEVEKANRAVQKLMAQGVDESVAKLLADTMAEIAEEKVSTRVAPVEQMSAKREVDSWVQDFARSHNDYDELKPRMEEVFSKLPEPMKNMVVADKLGLEMLYRYVKGVESESAVAKAKQDGRNEAYNNQKLKTAISGTPNSAPTQKNTPSVADIESMSIEQYRELVKKYPGGVDELLSKLNGN